MKRFLKDHLEQQLEKTRLCLRPDATIYDGLSEMATLIESFYIYLRDYHEKIIAIDRTKVIKKKNTKKGKKDGQKDAPSDKAHGNSRKGHCKGKAQRSKESPKKGRKKE